MEPLLDGTDFENIAEALQEVSGLTDKMLQLKRNTGFTGGALNGVAPTPTYLYYDFMGTWVSVTQEEMVLAGGMLSLGDMVLTTTMDIQFKGEGGGGYTIQQGDVIVNEGKEWGSVGIPFRNFVAGGVAYTKSFWRRGNA